MTTETKWQPGMWKVAGPDLPKCVVASAAPDENLLVINETEGLAEFPTPEAAALFAAAPDLYAALALVLRWHSGQQMRQIPHDVEAAIGTALRRARGES